MRTLSCSPTGAETRLSFAALSDLLKEHIARVGSRIPGPQRRALEVALLLEDPGQEEADQRTVGAATLGLLRRRPSARSWPS